jgi:FkbM family methyltransferase
LPAAAVEPLRRPEPAPRALAPLLDAARQALRRGGIPRTVRTFVLPDNPARRFVNADSLVLQQLYWFGERGWEPELLPWWRHLCARASRVVELGTNVGYFAVQGAKAAPGADYLAVEPHPVSAAVCRENLALNGIGSVEVLAAAASADPTRCSVELAVPWEQLGAPTVAFVPGGSELPRPMADRVGTTIEVPAVDVRSLLADVDLLKLDVEGQEHALLSAAWERLRVSRPTVVVEVLPGTPLLRDVLVRLCTELAYTCYVPTPTTLLPLAPCRLRAVSLRSEYGVHDLVLCARDRLPTTVSELDAGNHPR